MLTDLKVLFSSLKIDLIVLNRPNLSGLYKSLYKQAEKVIWTDGAGNHLLNELKEEVKDYMPTLIIGDLDSLEPETADYFSGVPTVKDDDVDTTDLHKALNCTQGKVLIILTDHAGRLDHTIGAFSCILNDKFADRQIYLYGYNNIAFFIKNNGIVRADGWKYCGLLPLLGRTFITSQGLRWNMDNLETGFGLFVSTCNEFTGEARISCSLPILFTISKE
jgi:thiamine pyrophosphokinase